MKSFSFAFAVVAVLLVVLVAVSADDDYVVLNNGLKFPKTSFGLQVYSDDEAEEYTGLAIKAGFRNFFSSVLAGNQYGFGQAVKSATVSRDELFICGSVNSASCADMDDCYTQTKQGCAANLASLDLDYVDMIMLDYPANAGCDSILGQWKAFEEMLAANQTRSIAVSNFSPAQLDCIINAGKTVPAVNQMHYNVDQSDPNVVSDDAKRGVVVQAYSPLASGSLPTDPDCVAIGKAHDKSGAQVALRWIVQNNATFTCEAKTLEYFEEDIDVYDFELTAQEMLTLDAK